MASTTYQVEGKEVKLTDKDYIAQGGFGRVYRRNNLAYKIYFDPTQILPPKKIAELQLIQSPFVIKPEKTIFDKSGPVGYTMKFLDKGEPLAKLFTNTFIKAKNLSNDRLVHLVKRTKELVQSVHNANILLVDLNEFNFLLDNNLEEIYGIDADGYQTPSFPATAIMESIRDRQNKVFSTKTDWFSYAIIAFQILTGIHPFRGNNPDFTGTPKEKMLDARMLGNCSVLNSKTTFPASVRPFSNIPKNLLRWFQDEFENGSRTAPPDDFDKIALSPTLKTTYSNTKFKVTLLKEYEKDIQEILYIGGKEFVFTTDKIFINDQHNASSGLNANLFVDGESYQLEHDKISILEKIGNLEVKTPVANLLDLPNSTILIHNGVIQNMCGSPIFFHLQGKSCYQIRLKELENNYRIIDGKYERGVLTLLCFNLVSQRYDIKIFILKGSVYELCNIDDVYPDLCVAVNSAEVVFLKTGDDAYFFKKSHPNQRTVVANCGLDLDELHSDGISMIGVKGNKKLKISNV